MEKRNIKVLGGLLAVALFMLVVFYVPRIFEQGTPLVCFDGGTCQHEEYLADVISYLPAVIILGFVLGAVASYLYSERKIDLPAPSPDRRKALLSLLQPSERKVVERLVEKGGSVLQSEISRMEGVGKVRAHRVVERLMRRGVLEKEQVGKTNVLKLRKDILDAL